MTTRPAALTGRGQKSQSHSRAGGNPDFIEMSATLPGVPLYEALGYRSVMPVQVRLPDGTELKFHHMRKVLPRHASVAANDSGTWQIGA
jgi:hypothetical protein